MCQSFVYTYSKVLNLKSPQNALLQPNPLPCSRSERWDKMARTTQVWSVNATERPTSSVGAEKSCVFQRSVHSWSFYGGFFLYIVADWKPDSWFFFCLHLQTAVSWQCLWVVWRKSKKINKPLSRSDYCHSCVNFTLLIFRALCMFERMCVCKFDLHECMFHINVFELTLHYIPFCRSRQKTMTR